MKNVLSIILFSLFPIFLFSQNKVNTEQVFVQFTLNESIQEIEYLSMVHSLDSIPGLQTSRFDYYSGAFFGLFEPGIFFTQEHFVQVLNKYGKTIDHLYTGLYGVDPLLNDVSN